VPPRRLRLVADLLRLSLVLGPAILLLVGREEGVWSMTLVAVAAVVLRWARAPAGVDLLFVALLAVDAWLTSLGAFQDFNRNDHVGHFLLPAAVAPVLFHLAVRAGVARDDAPAWRAGALAAALTIALGTLWEVVEWASDEVLGTEMSLGYADTLGDLLADAGGAVAGGLLLALTRRRVRERADG
jgi:Predicted membrane protein (DUF2238)